MKWLLLLLLSAAVAQGKDFRLTAGKDGKPLLLAFYHPWYAAEHGPSKQWRKWDSWKFPQRYNPEQIEEGWRRKIASGDYPLIGPYDASDPEVVRWHFRLAKAAGIDGFICSWWKLPKPDRFWDWQYELFAKVLLPVASQEDFAIAVLDECAHYVRNYDALLARITGFLPQYARHPGYLKVNGEPVWFVYQVWDDWLRADEAARYVREAEKLVGEVFWIFDKLKATGIAQWPGATLGVREDWLALEDIDCYGTYSFFGHWRETSAPEIEHLYRGFAQRVRARGHAVQLPIMPGHDNTAVEDKPYLAPRDNSALLKRFLAAIDAARPEIAVVCSFNEWFEMTQVEPAINWEDPYLYLRTIAAWRGKVWKTPPLPPPGAVDPLVAPKLDQIRK